jgi:glycosyltransferase involved in cell wall biosynthesis
VERLKVLFLTNWYPTREAPARAIWVREHAKAVRLYDDVVVVHSPGPDPGAGTLGRVERETDEGLSEGIPTYRVWYRPLPGASCVTRLASVVRVVRDLAGRGFRPDVVHAHVYDAGGPALVIGRLHRIPVVVAEHFSSFARRSLGPVDLAKAWLAFRGADRVLPVSRALQSAIERYGLRGRFQVIPNAVDTRLFFPAPDRRPAADPKRLLFVGQLGPVKGFAYLLRALADLGRVRGDWRLDVVGDGEPRREYERLAAELHVGDRIAFHGLRSRQEVADFMRRADLFVLSSLCETFSVPVAEALATGLPVVVTRCGGPEEFVTDDVGISVPPADVDGLSRGLGYMLDHLSLYSSERIARYATERFGPGLVGARLHAVYRSLREPSAHLLVPRRAPGAARRGRD